MKSIIKLIVCLLIGLNITKVQAQQAMIASGGTASSVNGNVSYSVGQITFTTISNPTGAISQGIQRPFEIYTLGSNDFQNISLKMSIYPNPSTTLVNLRIDDLDFNSYEYQLFDITGKQILNKKICQIVTQISLENLQVATYFLNVSDNSKTIKSFKIIKTN